MVIFYLIFLSKIKTFNIYIMEKLTKQELNDLVYFWQNKGDLERFTNFEKLKPKIENEYPEILKAWNDYKTSIKIMNSVMDSIDN